MRPTLAVNISGDGALSDPLNARLVDHCARAAQDGLAPGSALDDLQELVLAMEAAADPDLSPARLVLAQCLLLRFKEEQSREDAQQVMRLARLIGSDDSLQEFARLYEQGRFAYEVGRRCLDPVLAEEATHYYKRARISEGSGGRLRKQLRAQLEDCERVTGAMLSRAFQVDPAWEGSTLVSLEFPLESFPVDPELWPRPRLRPRTTRPLAVEVLGFHAAASFMRTPKQKPFWQQERRDARGREASGLFLGKQLTNRSQVNQVSLLLTCAGTERDARAALAECARELHLWSERVNRWADVLSDQSPVGGLWARQRYLYGHSYDAAGRHFLAINADEPGITHEHLFRPGHYLTRLEVSYILNRLAKHPIPVSLELLHLAQQSLDQDEPRRAVVEAGTAAESALGVLYESVAGKSRDPKWTLGTLAQHVSKLPGALPQAETQTTIELKLVKPRNDAVHRAVVTRRAAHEAVRTSTRIVHHLFGLSMVDVVALDERLAVLSPWLDEYQPTRGGYDLGLS